MALRRYLCLAVAFVFAFNSLGYFALMLVNLYQVKTEAEEQIKSQLPLNMLTLIAIPTSDGSVCAEAGKGEFSLNGEMYDVATIQRTDDTLYCYCLNDQAETRVNLSLNTNDQVKGQSGRALVQNTRTQIKTPIETNYFGWNRPVIQAVCIDFPSSIIENKLARTNGFLKIETPPPRNA